mmetsp:Transcript_1204/g.4109  ORF Transcript_1204/g.4109 Transcript_1204/m.4109 type:complete len:211 (-) Transcript_1204:1953-2585(-)
MSKVAATRVTWSGYVITVSFQPSSVGAGFSRMPRVALLVFKWNLATTLNLTRCKWIVCASSDQFQKSQSSVKPFLGLSVIGSDHSSGTGFTVAPRTPSSAARGPKGSEVGSVPPAVLAMHLPGLAGSGTASWSHSTVPSLRVVAQISAESSSKSARSRTRPLGGHRFAGSSLSGRWRSKSSGAVARSPPVLPPCTWNSITCRVVSSSAIS